MPCNDPQQELFTEIKLRLESLGYDVYDGCLPPENTPYPFVYLGNMQQADISLKNAVMGTVYFTIHVWHDSPKKRGTVSKMVLDIKRAMYAIDNTASFAWYLQNVNQRMFADTTTKTPLLHAVLEIEFKFS